MTCRLVLQPEAEADLDEAYLWYEAQCRGLGRELIECVEAAFERFRLNVRLPRHEAGGFQGDRAGNA